METERLNKYRYWRIRTWNHIRALQSIPIISHRWNTLHSFWTKSMCQYSIIQAIDDWYYIFYIVKVRYKKHRHERKYYHSNRHVIFHERLQNFLIISEDHRINNIFVISTYFDSIQNWKEIYGSRCCYNHVGRFW